MAYQAQEIFFSSNAPVTVDEDKCIAEKGCTVCVDVCPMDLLAINPATQKAYMAFDECWYCMPCEKDCPTGAVNRGGRKLRSSTQIHCGSEPARESNRSFNNDGD